MKQHRGFTGLLAPALIAAGCLAVPASAKTDETADYQPITELLADAKTEAAALKADSSDLQSFTNSNLAWETYADKISMIKDHVNNTGGMLAKLKEMEGDGSPWQQNAIRRIEPLLKELAENTEATIDHLNENKSRVHMPAFKDYVKGNCQLATDLEALIRDFVSYGETRQKFERLADKLEVNP